MMNRVLGQECYPQKERDIAGLIQRYSERRKRVTMEHGAITTYRKGCRCLKCKMADTQHKRRRTNNKRPAPEHGLLRYNSDGCRCDICKEACFISSAATKYGIPQEAVMALRDIKSCDICGKEINTGTSKSGHIDHCHETGRIRGMLCQNCNNGLGHFKDNTDTMSLAIKYLKKY